MTDELNDGNTPTPPDLETALADKDRQIAELVSGTERLAAQVDDLTIEVEALKAVRGEAPPEPPVDAVHRSTVKAALIDLNVTQADADAIVTRAGQADSASKAQWGAAIEHAMAALNYDASRAVLLWVADMKRPAQQQDDPS